MELVGYSRAPNGQLYLIGIGPREWLAARLHAGCTELVTRQPEARDFDEPSPERDLSGETIKEGR